MNNIGKYKVLEELGQGGMGAVYKAYDPLIEREVAIKLIWKHIINRPGIKERFYREAQSAGKLSHENIVTIYDISEHEGTPFIVMEYLKGKTLENIIDTRSTLTKLQKLSIAQQICRGLEYSHACDVIHRDIKPSNIYVLDNSKVKIIDFGIAKIPASALTASGSTLGSPYYMSPEQIKGIVVDNRTDIFSFGIVLYELLSYEQPFTGDNTNTIMYKIVNEKPEHIDHEEIAKLSGAREVIEKCLRKSPDERYSSAGAILAELQRLIEIEKVESQKREEENRKRALAAENEKVEQLLAQAHLCLNKNDFDGAEAGLEQVSKLRPHHREALLLMATVNEKRKKKILEDTLQAAQQQLSQNAHQKALQILNSLLKLFPNHPEALKLIAAAQAAARREAENKRIEQCLNEARQFLDKNEFDQATPLLEEVLKLQPAHEQAIELKLAIAVKKEEVRKRKITQEKLAQAQASLNRKEYEEALTILHEVLEIIPEHTEALALVDRTKQLIKAAAEEREVMRLLAESRTALDQQEFDAAAKLAGAALQIRSENRDGRELLRRIEQERKQVAENQKFVHLLADSRTAFQRKELELAEKLAAAALQIRPENHETRELLNKIQREHRLEVESQKITQLLAEAQTLAKAGDLTGAINCVEEILARRPEFAEAQKLLESLTIRQKKADEQKNRLVAEKFHEAQKAYENENYSTAIETLREVLELASEHAEAATLLTKAIAGSRKQIEIVAGETQNYKEEKAKRQAETPLEKPGVQRHEVLGKTRLADPGPAATRLSSPSPAETRLSATPSAETRLGTAREDIGQTKIATPQPVIKKPATRIYLLVATLVLFIISGVIYKLFFATPSASAIGYVALNIIPWAEITKIEDANGKEITGWKNKETKVYTPSLLTLPQGRYKIYLTHEKLAKPWLYEFDIKTGETLKINKKILEVDYSQILDKF